MRATCLFAIAALAAAQPAVAAPKQGGASAPRLLPDKANGPVTILVSTDRQHLVVYDGDRPVAETTVSTGVQGHSTPHGVFSVLEKEVFHRSNLYNDAPMPFMQRLTWSGVALHEGHVTGRPASHGCVRLPAAFAKDLFRYTKRGARVVISREETTPAAVRGLGPFTPAKVSRFVLGETADEGRLPGEIAPPDGGLGSRRAQTARDMVGESPISILVNRKTSRLYVRRGFKPVFEAPIEIDDPARPLGAHLFVAQAGANPSQIVWSTVSVRSRTREAVLETQRPARDFSVAPKLESTAEEALSRIRLAPGLAARLSSLYSQGAALIISDEGSRREGIDGTNFIALAE